MHTLYHWHYCSLAGGMMDTVAPLLTTAPVYVVHCTMNTELTLIGGVEVLPLAAPTPSTVPPCWMILQAEVEVLHQTSVAGSPAGTELGIARTDTDGTETDAGVSCDEVDDLC